MSPSPEKRAALLIGALLLLELVPGSASAQVVLARVVRDVDVRHENACGVLMATTLVEYEVVRELWGGIGDTRFYALHVCADLRRLAGTTVLAWVGPSRYLGVLDGYGRLPHPVAEMRREVIVELVRPARILGMGRAQLALEGLAIRNDPAPSGWVALGFSGAARLSGDLVVELRVSIPPQLHTCNDVLEWAGFANGRATGADCSGGSLALGDGPFPLRARARAQDGNLSLALD